MAQLAPQKWFLSKFLDWSNTYIVRNLSLATFIWHRPRIPKTLSWYYQLLTFKNYVQKWGITVPHDLKVDLKNALANRNFGNFSINRRHHRREAGDGWIDLVGCSVCSRRRHQAHVLRRRRSRPHQRHAFQTGNGVSWQGEEVPSMEESHFQMPRLDLRNPFTHLNSKMRFCQSMRFCFTIILTKRQIWVKSNSFNTLLRLRLKSTKLTV